MIKYELYKPGEIESKLLYNFLTEVDDYLTPTLSSRVNLEDYSGKLSRQATNFVAFDDDKMIGLSSFYFNEVPDMSFGTYLCVKEEYQKDGGVGIKLLTDSIDYCEKNNSKGFWCAIRKTNKPLRRLYKYLGFTIKSEQTYPNSDVVELYIEKIFILKD